MSRIKVLAANPRRGLAALATVLVAVGVTGASGANFNAATANPANTFAAGTLSMSNDKENVAILEADDLRPGGPAQTGEVVIENTGSLDDAPFTLAKGTVVDSHSTYKMSELLDLTVTDCGADLDCATAGDNDEKYSGTLADMGTAGHAIEALGDYDSGDQHKYEFSVSLQSSADDNYQGQDAEAEFLWTATS
jgi:hypothetical protein